MERRTINNNKIFFALIVSLYAVITLTNTIALAGSFSGKIITLKVNAPSEIKAMIENLLTEKGFIIVDDDKAPSVIKITAEKKTEGTLINSRITYNIKELYVYICQKEIIYRAPFISSYAIGEQQRAEIKAINELKIKLMREKAFIDALNQIKKHTYYEIPATDINEIRLLLMKIATNISSYKELSKLVNKLLKEHENLKKELNNIALNISHGRGKISQNLIEYLKTVLRACEIPYSPRRCPQADNFDYSAIGAVLIKVPVKELSPGSIYKIYAEDQTIVYRRNRLYPGPRVFNSMSDLKKSSISKFLKNKKNYLRISALKFYPSDNAIIISFCDANRVINAHKRGMNSGLIFKKGLIVLIPNITKK